MGKVSHAAARKLAPVSRSKVRKANGKGVLGHTFPSAKSARALPSLILDPGRIRAAVEPRIMGVATTS